MEKTGERILFEGRWLGVKEKIFRTQDGREVKWECLYRPGVRHVAVIVARLVPSGRFLILEQWRQSVERWVLGFPAGLVPEHVDDAAIERALAAELREETGYTGVLRGASPLCPVNAGYSEDVFRVYTMDVDENAPENIRPQQELEPAEVIRVHALFPGEIPAFIARRAADGCLVGAGLWYLFGLRLGGANGG